jgi:hypothetical protein
MISAAILVLTVGALIQFFVAYSRTLLLTYSKIEISERTREITGLGNGAIGPEDFHRLLDLLRVAPDPSDDALETNAVSFYYRAVQLMRGVASLISVRVRDWAQNELSRCAYFAAVALDRRLAPVAQ